MGNIYNITVINQSGISQNYAIFNKKPDYAGKVGPTIWTNVLKTAQAPNKQTANFSITNQFYAIVGNSSGKLGDKVTVNVAGSTPITLGSKNSNGTTSPGTTLKMIVDPMVTAPKFDDNEQPAGAFVNCFEVLTDNYDRNLAAAGNWIIGLGGSSQPGSLAGPVATIFPEPGNDFQIQPSNTWYVVPGLFVKGAIVDYTKVGNTCEVDMLKYPTGQVTIVQDNTGKLHIQQE